MSACLRNLHEQFAGIVQFARGRRGALRSRKRLPEAALAAIQQAPLGASEAARCSPLVFDGLDAALAADFFTGCSRGVLLNSVLSALIMAVFQ
jgi:hypothetical protein